ncbi:hypothetical protein [Nocardia cerradoensis]|uniref:Uncharacterized protein n=1 Tax=Nocardia cerradoensis TaxID=85688 RepID=A0A231GZM7_9NOCA|nr:hypothetical protein [Nocardia cerradoensis]NKY41892.1 hypothetical protein [Nocardia cerradoensis]OXR42076.1 hypothetical protein B7C42_05675 [Nocardia cerradoensis]
MTDTVRILTTIGTRNVTREQVRAWESRRATAVLGKLAARLGHLGMNEIMPDRTPQELRTAPLDEQRYALTTLKTGLGHAGIYALLRHELTFSERTSRIGVAASRGRTKHAVTRLEVPDYSAERFATWFNDLTTTNAETDMIHACPDHYLVRGLPDGRQEVVETTGGSPAATRFLIDYTAGDILTIPIDPDYPIQIAGAATLDDGLVIGGVRHQFRDRDGALDALLTVQFPATVPTRLIRQHQWHLAAEFSNWIIAAAPTADTRRTS